MTTPDPTPALAAGPCSNCIAFARDLAAVLAERDEARRAAANNAAWGQAWEADALTAQAALERASMGLYVASHENMSGEAATAIEGVRSEIRAALARLDSEVKP